MITTSRPLQAAAIGILLFSLLGGCSGIDTLVFSSVTMGVGLAPETTCRAAAALGGVLSAMRSAGGPSSNDLIDASRDAFVGALHSGAGLAAAVATATAVLALRLLRNPR